MIIKQYEIRREISMSNKKKEIMRIILKIKQIQIKSIININYNFEKKNGEKAIGNLNGFFIY